MTRRATAPVIPTLPASSRGHLSALRSLLVLAQLMTETASEQQILELAVTAAPSLSRCGAAAIRLTDGTAAGDPGLVCALVSPRPDGQRLRTYVLRSLSAELGRLAVVRTEAFADEEDFLLQALAHQTGAALANARSHTTQRAAAAELADLNLRLAETVSALRRGLEIHSALTEVAVAGLGRPGLATALHELTGHAVAVEDRYGHLQAWAGPGLPEGYDPGPPAHRDEVIRRALREGHPVRDGGRLVAVAQPQGGVLGLLVLLDPEQRAGEPELVALEHGTTVLAMELARLRSIAEAELRVRRDLVEELLVGTEEEGALRRAAALGYDLERRHRVVVVGCEDHPESLLHTVRRAARERGVGTLVVARDEQIVVLADAEADWSGFRDRLIAEVGGRECRVGVGSWCEHVADFPRSYREARTVLRLQEAASWDACALRFEDLGVYQLFASTRDPGELERFVERWLGALRAYDAARGGELVETLQRYLECGGSYEATAAELFVHRSTLKYRLQRIREISRLDINDPDTRFNLHLAARALTVLRTLAEDGAGVQAGKPTRS